MLNFGFNNYTANWIGKAGKSFGEVPVYKGKKKRVKAVLPADLAVTVLKGSELQVTAQLPSYLEAPLTKGQEIGHLVVGTGEQQKIYPLVAEDEVRRSNFLKVLWHNFILAIKRLMRLI